MTHHPDLPVEEGILDKLELELGGAAVVVEQKPSLEELALVGSEELGGVGVVVQHPEGGDGNDDSGDAFKDEDPPKSQRKPDRFGETETHRHPW